MWHICHTLFCFLNTPAKPKLLEISSSPLGKCRGCTLSLFRAVLETGTRSTQVSTPFCWEIPQIPSYWMSRGVVSDHCTRSRTRFYSLCSVQASISHLRPQGRYPHAGPLFIRCWSLYKGLFLCLLHDILTRVLVSLWPYLLKYT